MMKHIGLMFPGGGTHYIGMGNVLYRESELAKKIFQEANDILGYDLSKICFQGDLPRLASMEYSQPAIFTASIAAYNVFIAETGIVPQSAAGHSLGEYSALVCSGSLSFADGIRLIKKRGLLLAQMGKGGKAMMAVNKLESCIVEGECEKVIKQNGQVYIAVYNSLLQHVLSGNREDLVQLGKLLENKGASVELLDISTPSHCPLMNDAIESFREELNTCTFSAPSFSVVSNVTGIPYENAGQILESLLKHMVQPVLWQKSMEYMKASGINCFIEVGPRSVLKGLMSYINNEASVYAFDVENDREKMKKDLHVNDPDHTAFIKGCLALVASTKNCNYQLEDYKNTVIKPFAELQQMRVDAETKKITGTKIKKANELLQGILQSKKVSQKEILFVTNGLLNQTGVRTKA